MERQIQALLVCVGAGLRIITPGHQIGPGIREVAAKQGCGRGDRLGQLQRSDLITGIHAVAPAAEPDMPET